MTGAVVEADGQVQRGGRRPAAGAAFAAVSLLVACLSSGCQRSDQARDQAAGTRGGIAGPGEPGPSGPVPDATPPTPPSNLDASIAAGTVDLSWTGSGDDVGVEGYEVFRGGALVARTTTTMARETGLDPSREHCYTVVAFDAAGNRSQPSAQACARTPLSAPAGLTALLSAPTEVGLKWQGPTAGVGVAGYVVLRGDEVVAQVSDTRATVVGLAPFRRHCYTVRALDAAGNRSEPSAPACVFTPDLTPPTPPTQLASEARPAHVVLTWARSTDDVAVAGYEVLRSGTVVATVVETKASEAGLHAAEEHCYTVRAFDAAGNRSAPAGPVCGTPPDVTPPSVPGDLSASAPSETKVVLRWSPSSDDVGVAGYEAFRGDALVSGAIDTRASESGLRAGTKYCYVVRAYDAAGNRSPWSRPLCVSTPDLTAPTVPGSVAAAAGSEYDASVAWSASGDNVGVAGYEVFRGDVLVATVGETAVRDRGLRAAEQYCYAVRAFDAAGNRSPKSPPSCVVPPDVTPPSVPPHVAARALSESEVQVRWSAATDNVAVTGYELFRGEMLVARTPETSATESGLGASTEYCYTVRARDAAGNRSKPSGRICVTTPDTTPPTAPGNPVAAAPSDRQVDLSWAASTDNVGVAGYEVYQGVGRVTVRPELLVARASGTAASVSGLRPARNYCHAIVAHDAAGNRSSPAGPACVTTPDLTPPTRPENLAAAASSSREVLLAWDASKDDVGVAGYELLRGDAVVATVSRLQAADKGLEGLTEYCYGVRALDAAGNRSEPSSRVCVKTPDPALPAGPTRLRAEAIVSREVILRWDPSPDPGVHYVVYWNRNGWKQIGITTSTTYRIFGPIAREPHCYRVSAQNAQGLESPQMPELCTRAGEVPASARVQ